MRIISENDFCFAGFPIFHPKLRIYLEPFTISPLSAVMSSMLWIHNFLYVIFRLLFVFVLYKPDFRRFPIRLIFSTKEEVVCLFNYTWIHIVNHMRYYDVIMGVVWAPCLFITTLCCTVSWPHFRSIQRYIGYMNVPMHEPRLGQRIGSLSTPSFDLNIYNTWKINQKKKRMLT